MESLTAARAGALSGNEPSDALRVVNALLTQLDKLKHRKNVLIMSTSNLVQAIGELLPSFHPSNHLCADVIARRVLTTRRFGIYGSSRHCAVCRASTTRCDILDPQFMPKRTYASRNHQPNCKCRRTTHHYDGESASAYCCMLCRWIVQCLNIQELGDAKFAESFARNPALALNLDENIDRDRMRRASVLLYNLAGKCHVRIG